MKSQGCLSLPFHPMSLTLTVAGIDSPQPGWQSKASNLKLKSFLLSAVSNLELIKFLCSAKS